jgi:hypothetical protein
MIRRMARTVVFPTAVTRRLSAALSVLVLAGAHACDGPTQPDNAGVDAAIVADGIRITNERSALIFYFAVNAEVLPLIQWTPCVMLPQCSHVPPGETHTALWAQVPGADQAGDVVLHWWTVRWFEDGTGEAGPIRTIVLPR